MHGPLDDMITVVFFNIIPPLLFSYFITINYTPISINVAPVIHDACCMFHVESQRCTVIDFVCKRFVPPSSNQSNDHDTNDDNHTVKCKIFMEFSVLLQLRPFPNFLGSLIHISVSDIFLVD